MLFLNIKLIFKSIFKYLNVFLKNILAFFCLFVDSDHRAKCFTENFKW